MGTSRGQVAKRSATAFLPIFGAQPAEGAVCVRVVVVVVAVFCAFVPEGALGVVFEEREEVVFEFAFVPDEFLEVLVVSLECAFVPEDALEVVVGPVIVAVVFADVTFVFPVVEVADSLSAAVAVGVEREEESTAERFAGRPSPKPV